mgnify:CR=1 FL=1
MATGWQKVSGTWYYLKGSGAMAKLAKGRWPMVLPGEFRCHGQEQVDWRLLFDWLWRDGDQCMDRQIPCERFWQMGPDAIKLR